MGILDIEDGRARIARLDDVLKKVRRRLPRQERQMLRIWEHRLLSSRALADAMACHPATVYRRLKRVCGRVSSPAVIALVRHGESLSVLTYTVAMRRHLLGQSNCAIARELSLSRQRVGEVLGQFSGWLSVQHRVASGDARVGLIQGEKR